MKRVGKFLLNLTTDIPRWLQDTCVCVRNIWDRQRWISFVGFPIFPVFLYLFLFFVFIFYLFVRFEDRCTKLRRTGTCCTLCSCITYCPRSVFGCVVDLLFLVVHRECCICRITRACFEPFFYSAPSQETNVCFVDYFVKFPMYVFFCRERFVCVYATHTMPFFVFFYRK